jgi:ATP-binding cassette subfamily B protein
MLGFVPQTPCLFRGTVADNVRLGRPEATDDEVWDALRAAQAASFVAAVGGLDSPVERGGANLSGGQRQRLAVARAVVRRPRLYVFDDSFSALDARTNARLQGTLRRQAAGATVLVTTQRVATAMLADRVVVLDGGRVAGAGPPGDLSERCDAFRRMAAAQADGEATW